MEWMEKWTVGKKHPLKVMLRSMVEMSIEIARFASIVKLLEAEQTTDRMD